MKLCTASCKTVPCDANLVCGADGICAPRPCTEPGAPRCSEHYLCDPAAAATSNPQRQIYGAEPVDLEDPVLAAERGCALQTCSEPGGLACRANWRCDVSHAADPSGCVPIPCAETQKCSDDSHFICNPANAGPRPLGTDAHGCAIRNCEESSIDRCSFMRDGIDYGRCDVTAPGTSAYGCTVYRCDERPSACPANHACDPANPSADTLGCRVRSCLEGTVCPPPSVCEPSAPFSDAFGCRPAPFGAGGAGGAGIAASGGRAQGGTGGLPVGAGGARSSTGVCGD